MKFEKHLKNTGIYGIICKASDGTQFLRCGRAGNTLVRIPTAAATLSLDVATKLEGWIEDILIRDAEDLPKAELYAAALEKDGKAKDIRRIFHDVTPNGYGDRRCVITQEAFALIERRDDVRIFDPSEDVNVSDDELEPIDEPLVEECVKLLPALVIIDNAGGVEGIILDAGVWVE